MSALWASEFGDAYTERNRPTDENIEARARLWREIWKHLTPSPQSILEVGANLGANLRAIREVTLHALPHLDALEPNAAARSALERMIASPPGLRNVMDGTANAIPMLPEEVDMVFTSGVLIHVHPEVLIPSCREIHRVARKHIVCIEYFSTQPQEIEYRGHRGALWKRDFGALWLDLFPDLKPVACGFAWRRLTGLDDLTWWVFEKPNAKENR